ncbi:hypothetical protein T190_31870 [Sinorhizobium meliloti CCBAU 01290]|nr:hypothetical protein T190_31870 [Sinorhizobium meliloti CCBAU 01290]
MHSAVTGYPMSLVWPILHQFRTAKRLRDTGGGTWDRLIHCIAAGEYSYEAGHRAALEIARGEKTDAIFFANDILAAGGMDALRESAGLRVPEDVAVAGFDDVALARWPHYSLTTFRQPIDAIVEKAVSLVTQQLETPSLPPSRNPISGELVIRHSTVTEWSPEIIE